MIKARSMDEAVEIGQGLSREDQRRQHLDLRGDVALPEWGHPSREAADTMLRVR